uniref:Uncharacterized protein n=1 Tax=Panagrolaimus sp. JU765 TaxID=591449 RepID=A0AC34QIZ2_9BILA
MEIRPSMLATKRFFPQICLPSNNGAMAPLFFILQ